MGPDQLSRIENGEEPTSLEDNLPVAQLFAITSFDNQYEDIIQCLTMDFAPTEFTTAQKKHLVTRDAYFQLISSHLYKLDPDEILRHCVFEHEYPIILS